MKKDTIEAKVEKINRLVDSENQRISKKVVNYYLKKLGVKNHGKTIRR